MVSFVDPLKGDAAESVEQLKSLGIDVKILTGDALAVALNVCRSLGLVTGVRTRMARCNPSQAPTLRGLKAPRNLTESSKAAKYLQN
jgi:Mg2+-importing ATPase